MLGGGFTDILSGANLSGLVFNTAFDFTNTFKVLFKLVLVLGPESFFERIGVVENDVDDGAIFGFALAAFIGVAEESIKGALRVDFARKRDVGFLPRNMGTVKPGQVDITVDAGSDGLGAQLHGREFGVSADCFGGNLIDRDSICRNIRPGGAGDGGAGEPAGGFEVVPITFVGRLIGQPTYDRKVFFDRFKRA